MAPPNSYPKFPSRAERRSLIEQLKAAEAQGSALSGGEYYSNYLEKLKKLDETMDQYSLIDEVFGLPPTLDAAGQTALLTELAEVAEAGETFLAQVQQKLEEDQSVQDKEAAMQTGVPRMVDQIQTLLAQDYDALQNYNEKETPMSFPELQQLSRTKVVDFRGKKIGIMRNKLSDRIPMTVVDAQGNRRPGVFTKASYVDFMPKFNDMLQQAVSYYDSPAFQRPDSLNIYRRFLFNHDRPEGCQTMADITDAMVVERMKARVTGILPKFRDYLIREGETLHGKPPQQASEEELAVVLSQRMDLASDAEKAALAAQRKAELIEETGTEKEIQQAKREARHREKRKTDLEKLVNAIGMNTLEVPEEVEQALEEGFHELAKDRTNLVNIHHMGLRNGQRYDQRNSAMTALGSLMGLNHLVARSENMKFLDEEGNEVEGTFMEFAEGLDLHGSNGLKDFNKVADDPFAPPCDALCQIADLQVFDYLCGNVDRHGGNMSYTVDKNGKFTGIKAFDNDTSFGLIPIDKKNGLFRQAGLNDLMVITEEMSEKIQALTPEMLRFTLRGRGLSPAEIELSCTRLTELQDAVAHSVKGKTLVDISQAHRNKRLCVMKAEHLRKIHLNELPKTKYALFANVKAQLEHRMKEAREAGYHFDPEALAREGVPKPSLTEVSATERTYAAGGIADSMGEMARLIKNEVTGFEVGGLTKFLHSSGKWRDMISAVKAAAKAAEDIRKLIGEDREALSRNDPRVAKERKKANDAMEKARKATDAYLKRKMNEKHVDDPDALRDQKLGKHAYEQNRMNYALKLRDAIREYDKFVNPSEAEIQKQEVLKQQLDFANRRRALQKQQEPQAGQVLQ